MSNDRATYNIETHARDIENRLRNDMRSTINGYGADVDSETLEALVGDAMHQVERLLVTVHGD